MTAHPVPPTAPVLRRRRRAEAPTRSRRLRAARLLDVGAYQRIRFGETACSDGVIFVNHDRALVGLVSGAGRGTAGNAAARAFCLYATRHADAPLDEILAGAAEILRSTSGARAALLRFDPDGNALEMAVVGRIVVRSELGALVPPSRHDELLGVDRVQPRIVRRDLRDVGVVVLHTDGVGSEMDVASLSDMTGQEAAEHAVRAHRQPHADATAVVVRLV